MWSRVRSMSSFRRRPHPRSTARMARSPFTLHGMRWEVATGIGQATDAGGQIRAEESRICRFIGESSDCCKPHVDGARCKQPVFEMNPVAGDHRFIEGQPRLRTIPANEIVDGTPIAALRFRDRRLTSTADLTCSKSGRPSLVFCRFDFLVFLLMDAPPDGENWEWHDPPSHAILDPKRRKGL